MKHPDAADWMAYLYRETPGDQRNDLEAHLTVCPECAGRVERWRQTMGALDTARIPQPRVRPGWGRSVVRWAAAAAVVLGIGFALGRIGQVSQRQLDQRFVTFRAQFQQQLAAQRQSDLRDLSEASVQLTRTATRELAGELAGRYQAARAEDRAALYTALGELDRRRATELADLRGGLVQLASHTGEGFAQTENQMRLLASYLPADPADSSQQLQDSNQSQQEDRIP